jgi:hypothetical protein
VALAAIISIARRKGAFTVENLEVESTSPKQALAAPRRFRDGTKSRAIPKDG